MKIKEGFKLRTVGSEYIVAGEGLKQVDFNKLISLNGSAAYLWQQAEGKDFEVQHLADWLTKRYELSEEQALADAAEVASSWIKVGLVEE